MNKKNVNETIVQEESFRFSPDKKSKDKENKLCFLSDKNDTVDLSSSRDERVKNLNNIGKDQVFAYLQPQGKTGCDHRAAKNFSCLSSIEIS